MAKARQRRNLTPGKSLCTVQTSCWTILQEKQEQRQLWEGVYIDWDCVVYITLSFYINLAPSPMSGLWRWMRRVSGFLYSSNMTTLKKISSLRFSLFICLFSFSYTWTWGQLVKPGLSGLTRTYLRTQTPIRATQLQEPPDFNGSPIFWVIKTRTCIRTRASWAPKLPSLLEPLGRQHL